MRTPVSYGSISLRLVLLAAVSLVSVNASAGPDDPKPAVDRLVGQRMGNFTLKDVTTGKEVSLYRFRGNLAVVLVFLGTDCPVGDLYAPRLVELSNLYKDRKVSFLGINSNAHQ